MKSWTVCASVLATCIAACDNSTHYFEAVPPLPPGKIVPVGKEMYRVQEPPPIDVADRRAKQEAGDYCKKMNKTEEIKGSVFSLGSGLILEFRCVPRR